jgi:hypothetical protein
MKPVTVALRAVLWFIGWGLVFSLVLFALAFVILSRAS